MSLILEDRPWVVFDGECVLCNRFVGVLLTHERSPELRFATTRSRMGRALASRHGLTESDLDKTYLVVRGHQAWTRSDAWIELMSLMRAPLGWLRHLRVVPRSWRDAVYDGIARNRYRWFGHHTICQVPSAEARHRFELD
jgi:predicted DCC family thiol-disulfide oxidoreductase YuxK